MTPYLEAVDLSSSLKPPLRTCRILENSLTTHKPFFPHPSQGESFSLPSRRVVGQHGGRVNSSSMEPSAGRGPTCVSLAAVPCSNPCSAAYSLRDLGHRT